MDANQYFMECSELGLDPLEEAGGISSWLKRMYTATDDGLVNQLNMEVVHRVKTKVDQEKFLKEIDDFIAEAEHAQSGGKGSDFLHGGLVGMAKRGEARDTGKIRHYIEKLKKVRARVVAVKPKD
jgi:hypothetical protein